MTEKESPEQLVRLNQYFEAKRNTLKNGRIWEDDLNSETWFPNDSSHDSTCLEESPYSGEGSIDVTKEEKWEFFLEVDIEFTDENTARKMDVFPPAPINTNIVLPDISKKSKELLEIYKDGVPEAYESTKLLTHVQPRTNYILHSVNAELYTGLGMKITKVM